MIMAKKPKTRAAASGLQRGASSCSDPSRLEKDKAVKAEPISIEDKIKEASFRARA